MNLLDHSSRQFIQPSAFPLIMPDFSAFLILLCISKYFYTFTDKQNRQQMDDHASADKSREISQTIRENLDDPRKLEALYRTDSNAFAKAFRSIYPEISGSQLAIAWHERLNFRPLSTAAIGRGEWAFLLIAILIAGLILKMPEFLSLQEDVFYARNIGFAIFPMLTIFFARKNKTPLNRVLVFTLIFILLALYINMLPKDDNSDTLVLACIHLPLLLWSLLGYAYLGDNYRNRPDRIGYLRYNGDLLVLSALMTISGFIFSVITFGLFKLIGIDIGDFYGHYVVVFAGPAIPLLATSLIMKNPALVSRISPLIARIFTPLVFLMLLIFLVAMVFSGKDPYNDREFLLIFNLLLIGVMAIILFSVSEETKGEYSRIRLIMLLGLSMLTVIVNSIALSAILFRIFEFGSTPNRLAVLGSNLLIMSNLLLVTYRLFYVVRGKNETRSVEDSIAWFLPAYAAWTGFVVLCFPALFGFR